MAMRALPPGALRRRAFFGLLDADGWTAAFLKALFWFGLIIFLLGYIPDRAYYFTVSKTIDVGFNAIPLINWCPADNRDLPCPAPTGAVVPWDASPSELALPEPRVGAAAYQSGVNLYLVGGMTAEGATAETVATIASTEGNFDRWTDGPALPEAREGAAVVSLSGVPYVIGGLDADGAPTTTVYQGQVEEGVLTGWAEFEHALPVGLSDATAVGTPTGLMVLGGRTADGIAAESYVSLLGEANPPTLGAWEPSPVPLPEPRAGASGIVVGDNVYVLGGEGPDGVSPAVFRLTLDEGEFIVDEATGAAQGWAIAPPEQQLPEPRIRAATFTANGAIYVIGGSDAEGAPQASHLWAVPNAAGDLPAWNRREETDLPEPRAGAALSNVGSFAFLIGGEGPDGPVDSSFRANLSPGPPFFRLGMFGATIPALAIQGEIGQQLGYINAFGVGMTNFVILLVIGWMYSHRDQTWRLAERLSRGRLRRPREEEFPVYSGRP